MYKPVILVTGCGSGIGLALADLLYKQAQYRVVVTTRSSSWLELRRRYQGDSRFWVLPMDVTNAEERQQIIQAVTERWGGIDVLINNAGICYRAVVEHMTAEDELLQLETNYLGPMALIRLVLPYMRKTGRGKIINISSVSGMLAMPTMASYSASKYALEGASEALWYETKPLGINVSLIQPGFVRSASFERVRTTKKAELSVLSGDAYEDYYSNIRPFIAKLMGASFSRPERIAKLILRVIQTEKPPLWISATFDAFCFYYLRRLLPRRWLLPTLFNALPGARKWAQAYSRRRKDWSLVDSFKKRLSTKRAA